MHKNLEKYVQELQDVKDKCEELRGAKQDAIRELLTLQEQQRAELRIINNSLMEETSARECLERRIGELRTEVCVSKTSALRIRKFDFQFPLQISWNDCKLKMQPSGENASDWKQKNWLWNEITRKFERKYVIFKNGQNAGDDQFRIQSRSTGIYNRSWLIKIR